MQNLSSWFGSAVGKKNVPPYAALSEVLTKELETMQQHLKTLPHQRTL